MRTRTAYVSCAIVAAFGLLAPTTAMATGWGSCSSFTPNIEVVEGPCPVSNPESPACSAQGNFTGIKYQNTGSSADHLATLVTRNNTVSGATGNQTYNACSGDPLTGLGKHSCHEKAVKINPYGQTVAFWVVVDGRKAAVETSVAAKKGSCIKSFAKPGLGLEGPNAFLTTQKTETLVFKGCAVTFELNATTGEVVNAFNDPSQSDPTVTCSDLIVSTVDKLNLTLDGVGNLGFGQVGDGFISSGEDSCTTRVIGGRVYTWGSPCP